MSFLSDGDHRQQQGTAEMTSPPALDLLDEYWFFSNSLVVNKKSNNLIKKPPLLPTRRSPSTCSEAKVGLGGRRLLRTPSLPSPRVGIQETPPAAKDDDDLVEDDQEVDDDDLNWSSIYEGVLRTRMAERNSTCRSSPALQRAPSMPVAPSPPEMAATKSTPSMPRLRHSYSTLDRHHQTPRRHPRREVRSFSANQQPMVKKSVFQEKSKTWKSSSDLEAIEVQGFKDLGFVFDKEELRENLADVLPGLKSSAPAAAAAANHRRSSHVPRPYFSEAWHHVRRPPAAIRDARSAAEMKDQLRMWAQAVACNARQEC